MGGVRGRRSRTTLLTPTSGALARRAGTAGHYPVNKDSLYYTDKNALVVSVEASSPTVKVATFTVHKGAGGAEAGVEQ